MDDTQNAGGLDNQAAVEKLSSILTPQPKEETPVESEVETESPEEAEAQPEGEEEIQDEASEDSEEEELYEVVINGKKEQVTFDELLKGYSREKDYTQKTQSLAEERRAVEQERQVLQGVHKSLEQLSEVVTYVQAVNEALQGFAPQAPDLALLDSNPNEYYKAKIKHEEAMKDWQKKVGLPLDAVKKIKEQSQGVIKQMQAHGRTVLEKRMPDLFRPENVSKLYSYLQESYGYTKELIDGNVDPFLFEMAEKARLYDDLMSKPKRPVVKQQRESNRPKPRPSTDVKAHQRNTALGKFKENPSSNNAVEALKALM